jgi:Protein of unknown function (DUF3617)
MRTGPALGAFALFTTLPGTLCAIESGLPQSGRYEVAVALELPNLDDAVGRKLTTICVSSNGAAPYGLKVLTDNNPLAKCSPTNSRLAGKMLTFDIVCEGTNAAQASATYAFDHQGFEGRIAMKMGGKNMTMSETQRGRWIGDCSASQVTRQ